EHNATSVAPIEVDPMRYDPSWLGAEPFPQLIDGRESQEGMTHPILDPSTGETPAAYFEATAADVDAAIGAARRSDDSGEWLRLPGTLKAQLLDAVAAEIRASAERLAALEALDTGKAVSGALTYDVYEAANAFSHA